MDTLPLILTAMEFGETEKTWVVCTSAHPESEALVNLYYMDKQPVSPRQEEICRNAPCVPYYSSRKTPEGIIRTKGVTFG